VLLGPKITYFDCGIMGIIAYCVMPQHRNKAYQRPKPGENSTPKKPYPNAMRFQTSHTRATRIKPSFKDIVPA